MIIWIFSSLLLLPEARAGLDAVEEDLDATNQYIATKWDQLNRTVDMFFTNKISPKENKSNIFVYSSYTKTEGQKGKLDYDFQLKFDLPNTTKKLKIIIEKQQDDIANALSDTSVANNKVVPKNGKNVRTTETSKYTAGINYLFSKSKYFKSFVSFNIRLDMPINPAVKLELQKTLKTKYMNIGLSQKFILYRQEGLQEISQFVITKKLSKNLQLDQVNSLVWTDLTDHFVLRNSLSLSQDLNNEKSLSYSIGANAQFSPSIYYESYDTSVSYRQLLHSDWLYGTLSVGASFPKDKGFRGEKFAQVRLDLFFKED